MMLGMSEVQSVFGPGGALARALPGYESRQCQVQLSTAVDACFEQGGRLLAEAGTGTGKSLAYLVPAAARARAGVVTVIATAGINLQEQLVSKDLPLLKRATGWDFSWVLAKGMQNYLCRDRFEEARNALLVGHALASDVRWSELQRWADSTTDGDVSELPFELRAAERELCTCSSEECPGSKCTSAGDCFVRRSRARIRNARIIVTNYHLFFADFETGGAIFPPYRHLVWDEGHRAAEIARDFFGFKVSGYAVRRALGRLRDHDLKAKVQEEAEGYFGALLELHRSQRQRARLNGTEPELDSTRLENALGKVANAYDNQSADEDGPNAAKTAVKADNCRELVHRLEAARTFQRAEDLVYFLEEVGPRVAIACKPVLVAKELEAHIFKKDSGLHAVVVTSATLATGKGDFDFCVQELGAYEADTFTAASPFDYASRAMLVLPDGGHNPQEKGFADAAARLLVRTVEEAHGRTLALFTSYRVLELAYSVLQGSPVARGIRVMKQGDAPRTQLVERFREDVSSVLLGTSSFWEGVDVVGEALSALFIDKLPFANPTDPLIDAINERDRKAFQHYLLPLAIIAFRQGFGRLIRSQQDRGVVVCCDERLVTKGYGRQFVRALPAGLPVSRDLAEVGRFFGVSKLMETRVSISGGGGASAA